MSACRHWGDGCPSVEHFHCTRCKTAVPHHGGPRTRTTLCVECQPPVEHELPDVVELMERNHDRFPRASSRAGAEDWS